MYQNEVSVKYQDPIRLHYRVKPLKVYKFDLWRTKQSNSQRQGRCFYLPFCLALARYFECVLWPYAFFREKWPSIPPLKPNLMRIIFVPFVFFKQAQMFDARNRPNRPCASRMSLPTLREVPSSKLRFSTGAIRIVADYPNSDPKHLG